MFNLGKLAVNDYTRLTENAVGSKNTIDSLLVMKGWFRTKESSEQFIIHTT